MSTINIYKRVLLGTTNNNHEEALILGLNWIKENLKRELKLIPVEYKSVIENKILSIKYPELVHLLKLDLDKVSNNCDQVSIILVRVINLEPTDINVINDLCAIISNIRKNSEEQAILKGFKLS